MIFALLFEIINEACVTMNVYVANVHRCTDLIIQNPSERSKQGHTHASAHMHCVTMNVYRAECVTELGPNNTEPSERFTPMRAHRCTV